MKLEELFESKVTTSNGYVSYSWKTDLADEEDENYLPEGYSYSKVLELETIKLTDQSKRGQGLGKELMEKFLASPAAKKAELIFLDLNPHIGDDSRKSLQAEEQIMNKLEKFYKQFGFRNKSKHMRMWLVIKGTIPTNKLPT